MTENISPRGLPHKLLRCAAPRAIALAAALGAQHYGNAFIVRFLSSLSWVDMDKSFFSAILTFLIHGFQVFILISGWLWIAYDVGKRYPRFSRPFSILVPLLGVTITWKLLPWLDPTLAYVFPLHLIVLLLMIVLIQLLLLEVENWLDRGLVLLLWIFSFQSLELLPNFSGLAPGTALSSFPMLAAPQGFGVLSMAGSALFFSFVTGAVSSTWLLARYSVWLNLLRHSWAETSPKRSDEDENLKTVSMVDLGSLVHDLKNPLTAIKGVAAMMNDEADSDKTKLLLRTAEYMERIIREMLHEEERSVIKISSFFETLEKHLRPFPWGEEVSISLDPETADLSISVNEIRLVRALLNILDNAWRANRMTESQGIDLRVRHNFDFLEIEAWDNGSGYTANAHKSSGSGWGSTGLGLAFVRRVVNLHGGTLLLLPRPDKKRGTVVVVTLPLVPLSV